MAAMALACGCSGSMSSPAPDPAATDDATPAPKARDAGTGGTTVATMPPDAAVAAADRPAQTPVASDAATTTPTGTSDASSSDLPVTPVMGSTLAFVGGDDGNVFVFAFDTTNCTLTQKSMLLAVKDAWYGAVDPTGQRLYIGSLAGSKVLAYTIDRTAATLTLINSVAVGGPAHISLDRRGKFLFAAGFGAGRVTVLPIRADGGLDPGMSWPVGSSPHSTAIDPSNKYLFVQNMGSDAISQFTFDQQAGSLAANTPATLMLAAKIGPRNGAFHPTLPYYYTANEISNTVSTYSLAGNGTLTVIETQTAVPPGFASTTYVAEVHVAPSGKFAYVSNRGADTIAVFGIDQATGKLTPLGQAATGGNFPQSQNWDATGQHLLSANVGGKSVTCFAVDQATGALTKKSVATLSAKALWVGVLPR